MFRRILKLGARLSYVPREARQIEACRSLPRKVHMSKIQVYRSLIAAAVIGAVWYFAVLSQAAELHPIGRILARGLNAIANSR
jgi:predicted secreted protein